MIWVSINIKDNPKKLPKMIATIKQKFSSVLSITFPFGFLIYPSVASHVNQN
jgi:hypothetical protein